METPLCKLIGNFPDPALPDYGRLSGFSFELLQVFISPEPQLSVSLPLSVPCPASGSSIGLGSANIRSRSREPARPAPRCRAVGSLFAAFRLGLLANAPFIETALTCGRHLFTVNGEHFMIVSLRQNFGKYAR